ncbi:MAG: RMD1 family protein [Bradyrhizobium sp.]|uniref:RMD1 family protein n=1 Tax=Bradyrhizobium sp. TaxID=376 RepID=UPI002A2E5AC1|nr:RMD1 family protein [Bradyrhizobium sp.]
MADRSTAPVNAAVPRRQSARALRLGGRLNLAGLDDGFADLEVLGRSPLVLRLKGGGVAGLFPYGTAVFVGASAGEQQDILDGLANRIEDPIDTAAAIEMEIEYGTSTKFAGDRITIKDESPSSLIAVADALARHVAITFEEEEVRKLLLALEPFTGDLANSGRLPFNRRRMLRTVGEVFRTHRRLLERVDVEDKPELDPEHSEARHLWDRLIEAYQLKKRAKSVSNKLEAIEVMMSGLTELINAQRELRVELLIVLLIAIEIGIWIYESFIMT